MSKANAAKCFYLRFVSQPKHERTLYRWISKHRPTSIVEIGIHDAKRTERMIQVAASYSKGAKISYCGIDLFEMDPQPGSLSLREAHKRLAKLGASIRLLPGDPFSALSRSANAVANADMFVANRSVEEIGAAWFYVPRMLRSNAEVVSVVRGRRASVHTGDAASDRSFRIELGKLRPGRVIEAQMSMPSVSDG